MRYPRLHQGLTLRLSVQGKSAPCERSLIIQAFNSIWERFLLNQFHDVLAGSAFDEVYEEVARINEELEQDLTGIIEDATQVLLGDGEESVMDDIIGVNSLPGQTRFEVAPVPRRPNSISAAQVSSDGTKSYMVLGTNALDTHLIARPQAVAKRHVTIHYAGDMITLTSSTISLTIDGGRITSIIDVGQDRELIPEGCTGGLSIVEDLPHDYDAWEIESYAFEDPEDLFFSDLKVVENGPLRTTLRTKVAISDDSMMHCNIILDHIPASTKADARHLIRFEADVDWHERHRLLYFAIPLNIFSEYATFDSQFGTVSRPTHRNTSWDAAKFEVCGHQFADLSEYGYGMALLNDCKYGYGVEGNLMRLTLLKGPMDPDKECDMGRHSFNWALYPHPGSYSQCDLASVARAFNAPLKRE